MQRNSMYDINVQSAKFIEGGTWKILLKNGKTVWQCSETHWLWDTEISRQKLFSLSKYRFCVQICNSSYSTTKLTNSILPYRFSSFRLTRMKDVLHAPNPCLYNITEEWEKKTSFLLLPHSLYLGLINMSLLVFCIQEIRLNQYS